MAKQQTAVSANICFSGGAEGADLLSAVGHQVIHYGFQGMKSKANFHVLTEDELKQADLHVQKAGNMMNRHPPRKTYVKNLIRRNYYQVKDAQRVYAITRWNLLPKSTSKETVEGQLGGGTGWALAMAIERQVPWIYLYAIEKEQWYVYQYEKSKWQKMQDSPPQPFGMYAGIGSRDLGEKGIEALQELFK